MAAIGQISGPLLKSNLVRQGIDLAFQTDLLYLSVVDSDPANHRIGFKTTTPAYTVDVNGTLQSTQVRATNSVTIGTVPITDVSGTLTVTGNLHTTGNITADGSIILGDANTDDVVFDAEINSNFIPKTTDTFDIGSTSLRWNSVIAKSSAIGDITISTNSIGVTNTSTDILLTPASTGKVIISSSTALKIPVGNVGARPTGVAGYVRFNTDNSQFEGYQGTVWSSLGGVRSTDGKTYIKAEGTPGLNDNIIYFYANDILQAKITTTETNISTNLTVQGKTTTNTLEVTGSTTLHSITIGSIPLEDDNGTLKITGNLHTTGNITADGSITLGDSNTDNVVFAADINSDFLPDITDTYAIGSTTKRWNTVVAKSSTVGDLALSTNNIGVANSATDIQLTPATTGKVVISSTTALKIPVGNVAARPTGVAGYIRFNTDNSQFEGYQGAVWSSLGGVRSTDGKTYIKAEGTPGLNDNIIYFYANDILQAKITTTETNLSANLIVHSNTTTGSLNVGTIPIIDDGGTLKITGNLHTTGNITADGSITLGDANTDNVVFAADVNSDFLPDSSDAFNIGNTSKRWNSVVAKYVTAGNLIISNNTIATANTTDDITLTPTNAGKVIISNATALRIPVGTALERPTGATGYIRFNTDSLQFEGYQGSVWSSLGGVRSTDGKTYIKAEGSPGLNDNILYFYANNIEQARITTTETQIDANLKVLGTTTSTSSTTGSITTAGGVGVAGDVNIAGSIGVSTNAIITGNATVHGNAIIDGTLTANSLSLTTALPVPSGGTGKNTFTAKGILYGDGTNSLKTTLQSTPGTNATTSYGILTTDVNNVPVWTDVIDEGTY